MTTANDLFNSRKWVAFLMALLAVILLVFLVGCYPESSTERQTVPRAPAAEWLTVPYGHLVDHSVITHSGETVGEVLRQLRARDHDHFRGLLQPYLEPHSTLCNERLPAPDPVDAAPLRNILEHYPAGSARPAWSDIAREGHFQVYYSPELVRLFLKGSDPEAAYEKFRSVVRHPVRDILHSDGLSVERVEVYAFTNDYAQTEIRLNATPRVFSADELNLSPRGKSLDLDSIEAFLEQAVALEAAETDRQNNLFFYGRRVPGATLAGQPIGISDLAAVYRAIFHHGHNEPYISLDRHEDNRYAKVNFGGLLENTHAGHVVLEADKLFKTLSTGLGPNTRRQVKNDITNKLPGFLVEDERSFVEPSAGEASMEIRYWFYPDNIGTVTDGSMGVVQSNQFFADAERMDVEIRLDQSVRDTIDHLNLNYARYEAALPAYRELGHLGRLFALVLWLRETNADERVELDDLLSVMLPEFSTSERTRKMLAVTAAVYPANVRLGGHNVRDYTRTYNLSRLLDRRFPSTTDSEFLRIAQEHYDNLDDSEKYSLQHRGRINVRTIASVGGGISLNPRQFRQTEMDPHSPLIRALQETRNQLQPAGPIAIHGDWVRSSPGIGSARINPLSLQ